jgi:flagellar hook-basal body protein
MSFYTSLTGLNAAAAQLSVVSNNIANVGTTGFKRSRADFGDIFATSPLQKASSVIGQGVALKQVSQEFSQGNIQVSSNSLDMAITGDGFFPLKSADGLQDIYTRNGTFLLDNSFNVVNSAGQALIAAAVDSSGKADLDNLAKLQIPRKTTGDAVATTAITLGLNFPADAKVITKPFDKNDESTYNKTTAVTVYDAGGNSYLATVYYAKTQVASTGDPTNKWQTYVYIGDTKLTEYLIQSQSGGEKLFVNKYGETRKESQISPELIARGVTKLYNLDNLKNPIPSLPASAKGSQLDTALNTDWKNGLNVYDRLSNMDGIGGETQTISVANAASALTTAGTISITLPTTDFAATPLTVSGVAAGDSPAKIAAAIAAVITDSGFLAKPGRRVVDNGDGTINVTFAKSDGALADTQNPPTGYIVLNDQTASGAFSDTPVARLYKDTDLAFQINVDSSENPMTIDLSDLNKDTNDTMFTGVEMARRIQSAINKSYGDERYFDFGSIAVDSGATPAVLKANVMTLQVSSPNASDTSNDKLNLTFTEGLATDGTGTFADLNKVTIEDAVKAMQSQVDQAAADAKAAYDASLLTAPPNPDLLNKARYENYVNVKVAYDPAKQTFTFKTPDNVQIYVSGDQATKGMMGVTTNAVMVDPSTGAWGEKIVPTGELLVAADQQRYATSVTYDDANRRFLISSGTTGDTSSIEITSASGAATALFGIDKAKIATSPVPLRGVVSQPAVLKGNAIGLNLDNKFRVDSTNNQFVVTVDNVTGLIEMPPKADYTIEDFRQQLEIRINALADSFGRTVNGVKVGIVTDEKGNKSFQFTTGSTGDSSYLKVSANSIWGLADLESARGTTSNWLDPKQATNADGFPLYVNRDGLETTDPGDFSEDETRDLWSPVFYDKGEMTFDTSGNVISPKVPIAFKSTTIGTSGATLQFSIDYSASTQYSSPFSVRKQDQNGRPEGDLIGVDIGDNGLVNASYSNGNTKSLAKIVLVNFAAPTGLRQIGDASYYATSKSGDARYGEAGSAGFGTIRAGARERANVDLTNELVELITAQRNFQANAKAIETNNTLTQAIINIRS